MFCTDTVKWLYKLERDFVWASGQPVAADVEFRDRKGGVRARISKAGVITVIAGYAWDGCTPKFCLFDVLFGIPDGAVHRDTGRPKVYYASLVHDVLYQFADHPVMPYRRREADGFFLRLMTETEFAPRHLYFIAVRIFGGLFRHLTHTYGKKRPRP